MGGVIGNATYDLLKELLQRHSRRALMAKVREILAGNVTLPEGGQGTPPTAAPGQVEARVEQALNKVEEQ